MKTTKELVKFDFDLAVITALDAKYKDIQITDGKSYAVVMQGLAEYRDLRLKIDDMHKKLKKDILIQLFIDNDIPISLFNAWPGVAKTRYMTLALFTTYPINAGFRYPIWPIDTHISYFCAFV